MKAASRRSDLLRAAALALSRAAVLAAIFVLAWRLAWSLPGFRVGPTLHFYLGRKIRVAEVLAVIASVSFVLASPWARFQLRRRPLIVFVVAALALTGLASLSSLWALKPTLAVVQGMHLLIWAAFALVVAGIRLPPERMAAAFVLGLLVHATVGFAQVIIQSHVGLTVLDELRIPPDNPLKFVQAGASLFLRAYGLSPHPNILAGHLAVGLILGWGLAASRRSVGRGLASLAWAMLFASLLLTFSRSGWLAALLGMMVVLMWLGRTERRSLRAVVIGKLTVTAAVIVAVFAYAFDLFLVPRILEALQGKDPRLFMMSTAMKLIAEHPVVGVGAGNSGEVTRLDPVHNIPLLITSELGLAGLAAVGTMVMVLVAIGYRRWGARWVDRWHGLVAGSLVALVTVGLFDHYLWTQPEGALLGAWLVGWWLTADPWDGYDPAPGGATRELVESSGDARRSL